MLSEDAPKCNYSNIQEYPNYADAITALQTWYNMIDQRARIPTRWLFIRMTEELRTNQHASEFEVFQTYVAKLMFLLKQIDMSY